jgi:hypothetical protein
VLGVGGREFVSDVMDGEGTKDGEKMMVLF